MSWPLKEDLRVETNELSWDKSLSSTLELFVFSYTLTVWGTSTYFTSVTLPFLERSRICTSVQLCCTFPSGKQSRQKSVPKPWSTSAYTHAGQLWCWFRVSGWTHRVVPMFKSNVARMLPQPNLAQHHLLSYQNLCSTEAQSTQSTAPFSLFVTNNICKYNQIHRSIINMYISIAFLLTIDFSPNWSAMYLQEVFENAG